MKYSALILGAGNSVRFDNQQNKLFYKFENKTILELSLNNFLNDKDCDLIVVVYNKNFENEFTRIIQSLMVYKKIILVPGGDFRHDSFVKGISYCKDYNYVMVHDAARPFLTSKLIENIKNQFIINPNLDAIIPTLSLRDSVIEINHNSLNYLNRDKIKLVQTPECFKMNSILNFINLNNNNFSDELS